MSQPAPLQPRRVLGIETEYGLSFDGGDGHPKVGGAETLFRTAAETINHLPCMHGGGIWLENGARFYIDCGSHPEYCTPETEDPFDTMRHVLAGDRILSKILAEVNFRDVAFDQGWRLHKCNVDYSGNQSTWACHESYSSRLVLPQLSDILVPHLVSRIIYTGAGGLNPYKAGIEFCLSPRVFHIQQLSSGSSTGARGILHEKDETLASRGWHRLHILCGDSVSSHTAGILKVGTTALVVALAEAGISVTGNVRLTDPVSAFHQFNRDPSLQVVAPLRSNRRATALDIQRAYLETVEQHLDHPVMPAWAPRLCQLWRQTLQRLEKGPAGVMTSLDWAIKWALYRHFAKEQGFPADSFKEWNHRVQGTLLLEPTDQEEEGFPAGLIPSRLHVPGRPTRTRAPQSLDASCRRFLNLRLQLCEAEIRFSRLGGDGLFETMDQAGQLDHGLPELTPESVNKATRVHEGPGRARLRSLFVRKHGRSRGCACDWSLLMRPNGDCMDISDPFCERFPRAKASAQAALFHRGQLLPQLMNHLWSAFSRGQYNLVSRELSALGRNSRAQRSPAFGDFLLLNARLHSRLGAYPRALEFLNQWSEYEPSRFALILEHVSLYRFQGLQPMFHEVEPWIREGDALSGERILRDDSRHFAYDCHRAFILSRSGHLPEARDLFKSSLAEESWSQSHPRFFTRALCDLADIYRRLDEPDQAPPLLDRARTIHNRRDLPGDFAEYYQTALAKCDALQNPGSASQTLHTAHEHLLANGSILGQARVIALESRLGPSASQSRARHQRLRVLQQLAPALAQCPLLKKILDLWPTWTSGGMPDGETDFFWNV